MDEAGVDFILVGDSLAMVVMGYDNTLPVTMDEMLLHTRAVRRAVKHAMVVADMPFGSYQVSTAEGVANATGSLRKPAPRQSRSKAEQAALTWSNGSPMLRFR